MNNSNSSGGHIENPGELELFKKTPEYKRIYHIRHKLQKLVYEKKPGEIQKEDFAKVSQVVKEIEDSNMTYDLLRVSLYILINWEGFVLIYVYI
jgi:predicted transglutaminase-like protease